MGDWSVKEILAHVTIWEEEALKYLPLIINGEKPPRYGQYGGLDAFNAQMIEQKKHWRTQSDASCCADVRHKRALLVIHIHPTSLQKPNVFQYALYHWC